MKLDKATLLITFILIHVYIYITFLLRFCHTLIFSLYKPKIHRLIPYLFPHLLSLLSCQWQTNQNEQSWHKLITNTLFNHKHKTILTFTLADSSLPRLKNLLSIKAENKFSNWFKEDSAAVTTPVFTVLGTIFKLLLYLIVALIGHSRAEIGRQCQYFSNNSN